MLAIACTDIGIGPHHLYKLLDSWHYYTVPWWNICGFWSRSGVLSKLKGRDGGKGAPPIWKLADETMPELNESHWPTMMP